MINQELDAMMRTLNQAISEVSEENDLLEENGKWVMRNLFSPFENNANKLLIETIPVKITDQFMIMDHFIIIANGLPDELRFEMIQVCNEINYYSNFGNFGWDNRQNALYFKHANTFNMGQNIDSIIEDIMNQYSVMMTIIKNNYSILDRVCKKELSAQMIINEGVLEYL